jgi:tRNA modification GTPase
MINSRENDTIIAPITAAVGGTVSIIRISGKESLKITSRYFSNKKLEKSIGGQVFSGYLSDSNKELIDQVVVTYYKSPKSYTGEDVIEISFHANPIIINRALDLFISEGCRYADPGEFTERAFINGKMDLIQAEAVADMINAKSKSVLNNSLKNLEGALSKKIIEIRKSLINTASLLQLDLDFTEEDLEIISGKDIINTIKPIIENIEELLNTYQQNRLINKGIEVLIIGKPNVGKSSLMNSLLKTDRVIVSDIPGTTRDIIHEDVILDGNIVRYIDTAGIRYSDDKIEIEGVERAKKLIDKVDIILLVLDLSNSLTNDDKKLIENVLKRESIKKIIIGNKTDRGEIDKNNEYLNQLKNSIIKISALKNIGIKELKNRLIETINEIQQNENSEIFLSNFRHYEALKKAKEYLINIIDGIGNQTGYEFLSLDLMQAIDEMSEILGEVTTDDILNNIFRNFCIGK